MLPNDQHIRNIFAEELEKVGETNLATMIRNGTDNSHGGQAAISAIKRLITEIKNNNGEIKP